MLSEKHHHKTFMFVYELSNPKTEVLYARNCLQLNFFLNILPRRVSQNSLAFLRIRLGFMCVRNAGDLFFHKLLSLEKALEIWQESEKCNIHSCNGH